MSNSEQVESQEITLIELFSIIWKYKFFLILSMFVVSVGSVYYAKSLPNVYQSVVLLSPSNGSGASGMTTRLSGLASLAGISLGNKDGGDKTKIAIEIMKSREFFRRFSDLNDVYVPLMASLGWNPDSGELILDTDVYNSEKLEWVRKVEFPRSPKPSLEETSVKFNKYHFSIQEDESSGMVRVITQHVSPIVAKDWANALAKDINLYMKELDQEEAKQYIAYLNSQLLDKTLTTQMQQIFYELIEEQTKNLMLSKVKEDYIFKVIDPAYASMYPILPKRSLLCFSIVSVSLILILTLIFITHFIRLRLQRG